MALDCLFKLDRAAKLASTHAGRDVTPDDFVEAAARGQVALVAICSAPFQNLLHRIGNGRLERRRFDVQRFQPIVQFSKPHSKVEPICST